MSQAEDHEALVQAVARAWCCGPFPQTKGCGAKLIGEECRAVGEEGLARARAVLAVIAEKAKEWPTEKMEIAGANVPKLGLTKHSLTPIHDWKGIWRAMLAFAPLVKPDGDR